MNAQIQTVQQDEAQIMEGVLLGGDLSKLTPQQRVTYYRRVCESLGLNPLTKPFDYMTLKKKENGEWRNILVLYAKKDATDQLRKINGVSIDDVDIVENATQFLVKVKGHDKTGRADVEIGVVNKTDMQGNAENVQMKAVTKAKRRLTLSICGLGMLDETEIQTIPDARPVMIEETGEIMHNPEPIDDKLKARYLALTERAKKVGVKFSIPNWDDITAKELTAAGLELLGYVSEAEAQQKAAAEPQA